MAAGPAPSLEEASAIYLMIVHPLRAFMVSRGFWKGFGTFVSFPSAFLLGGILPTALEALLLRICLGGKVH